MTCHYYTGLVYNSDIEDCLITGQTLMRASVTLVTSLKKGLTPVRILADVQS